MFQPSITTGVNDSSSQLFDVLGRVDSNILWMLVLLLCGRYVDIVRQDFELKHSGMIIAYIYHKSPKECRPTIETPVITLSICSEEKMKKKLKGVKLC